MKRIFILALALAASFSTPAFSQAVTATLPVTCPPSGVNCVQSQPVVNPDGTLIGASPLRLTNGIIPAGSPTYVATGIGYTAYATPTDMICIAGSGTKTIAITALAISPQATAQTLGTFYWIKRSAANTGGTLTNPAGISHDSSDAAATAIVSLYTAAPTLGTAVGNIAVANLNQLATTAQASLFNLYTTNSSGAMLGDATMATDLRKPIILRGVAESFCLNFNGAAIPVGFTAVWMVKWIEF